MNKCKIFLSHITEEKEIAESFKKGIENLYLNTVEVFVSSVNIKSGEKWLYKIENNLMEANLFLILTSQKSMQRPWINFEAGAGWALKRPVIPLCYNGITPSDLQEPLKSLQALNIEEIDDFKKLFSDISDYLDLGNPKDDDIAELYSEVLSKINNTNKNNDINSYVEKNPKLEENLFDENNIKNDLVFLNEDPEVFFADRMADAFPGIRGLVWIIEPKKAVYHISHLLKKPLVFESKIKNSNLIGNITPIWWFRGNAGLPINYFEILSDTKILINIDELEIDKIAVYRDTKYWRNFVYLETKPDIPTGLYNTTQNKIENLINDFGYVDERYGLLDGKYLITHNEYDDGSAIIDGKIVDAKNAKLRRRFLSKYNFIICAQSSPYNSHKHGSISEKYFNGILRGTNTFEEYFNEIIKLSRADTLYEYD